MDASSRFPTSLDQLTLLDDQPLEVGWAMLDRMLEAVPLPALVTDTDLDAPGPVIRKVNTNMAQMTGYAPQELIGQSPRLFQGPKTSRQVLNHLKECLRSGKRFWGDAINYRKSGDPYWVRWTILPVFWQKQLVGYLSFQSPGHNLPLTSPSFNRQPISDSFELLFEAAEVAICLVNEEYKYVRVNRAYCELVGLSETEILNNTCLLLQHPTTRIEAGTALKQAFEGDLSAMCREWHVPNAQGDLLRLFTQSRLIQTLEEQDFLVITVTDLERMKRQEDRKLAESRFQLAVQECGLGFWEYNLNTNQVYLSPGWKQILGYQDDELTNSHETVLELLHPDDRELVHHYDKEYYASQSDHYELTFRMRHKDGSYRWILSRGLSLRDRDNQIVRLVGKHVDVTELHLVEQQLLQQKQRLDTILQFAADTVLILDATGKRTYLNDQRHQEEIGQTAGQLLGRSFFEHLHPDHYEEARTHFQAVLDNPGVERRFSLRYLNRNQESVWLDMTAINLLDNPAIRGLLITAQDVTEQRRLQDQLRQAQKMESLGQLAGGIAHDFNNMLSIVIGNVELTLMEAPSELHEKLNAIHDAAFRAVDLAQQLLGFARKRQLQVRTILTTDLLAESLQLLHFAVGSKVRIHLDPIPDSIKSIRGDTIALQQAMVNLALNARDAMPNGGQITIRAKNATIQPGEANHPNAQPGEYVRIEVEDTGTGIAPDVLGQIFEPFFTTKPVGLGTGLGLPMVYGTVRQLGGWIDVESHLGRGTRFDLYLPASDSAFE